MSQATATTTSTTCRFHRRRRAQAVCVSCAAPVCARCLVSTRVGYKCRSCSGGRAPSRPRPRLQVALVAALGVLALAAGVVIALTLVSGSGGAVRSGRTAPPAPAAAPSGPVAPGDTCMQEHQTC